MKMPPGGRGQRDKGVMRVCALLIATLVMVYMTLNLNMFGTYVTTTRSREGSGGS